MAPHSMLRVIGWEPYPVPSSNVCKFTPKWISRHDSEEYILSSIMILNRAGNTHFHIYFRWNPTITFPLVCPCIQPSLSNNHLKTFFQIPNPERGEQPPQKTTW